MPIPCAPEVWVSVILSICIDHRGPAKIIGATAAIKHRRPTAGQPISQSVESALGKHADEAAAMFKEYGALSLVEC
jgi:hypothetical protein